MANEAEADRELQTISRNGSFAVWRNVQRWPKIGDCSKLFHDNLSPGTPHKNKVEFCGKNILVILQLYVAYRVMYPVER